MFIWQNYYYYTSNTKTYFYFERLCRVQNLIEYSSLVLRQEEEFCACNFSLEKYMPSTRFKNFQKKVSIH